LQRLVAVARKKFFAAGYSDSSLDDIGAAAKVGRGTLYRWFGGKEQLFKVAMLHAAAEVAAAKLPDPKPGAELDESLAAVAMAVSGALMSRTGTQLYRTAIAEAEQYPALARGIYALTRIRATMLVTQLLGSSAAGAGLTQEQLNWVARQFLTLCTDGNRYLSIDTKLTAANRRVLARRAVTLFLHGQRAVQPPG